MLKDKEGHEIRISQEGNGHILVYGSSGQGKTYFLCRMLEEYVKSGKRVLILDYSGSYSEKEMKEKNFVCENQILRFKLSEHNFVWSYCVNDNKIFQVDLSDALIETLECGGYFQKKLLRDALGRVIKKEENVSILNIIVALEGMLLEEKQSEKIEGNVENIGRLLTRLCPFEGIENFQIVRGEVRDTEIKPITIIELTDFPESQRKFLAEFMISILWKEIYRQEFSNRYNVLLLDEIQFLSVKEGSALSAMLREGRKRKVEIVLSTQFVSHYTREEIQALQQAENIMVFRPTPEDCRRSAKLIDLSKSGCWENVLRQLRKGEAVLKGVYHIADRRKLIFDPIVVKVDG